ncbi:hypothetical protein [Providencia stuartii]|uniref:hypothetical protein n=1 Tax=Providencia stuartii TaxID=588 RepID=UPI0011201FA5|nr:hypothetical protein [Providencia stuartii]
MKTLGTVLLLIGICGLGFGTLIWATASDYRFAEHITKIAIMLVGGSLSLVVGAIFFVGGAIENAILGRTVVAEKDDENWNKEDKAAVDNNSTR